MVKTGRERRVSEFAGAGCAVTVNQKYLFHQVQMLYRLEKVLVDRASTNINQVAFSVNLKSAQSRNVTMALHNCTSSICSWP